MSEALTVGDFAAQLSQAGQAEQPIEDSAPVEEVAAESQGTEAEQPEGQEPEAPAEGEEGQEDQPQEPESPEDRVVKWTTANGDEFEVTQKELQDGYLRDADYRQKTQNVAEERRQFQQAAQQQVQVVEQLAVEFGQLHNVRSALCEYQGVNWAELQITNPEAYQLHAPKFLMLQNQERALVEQIGQKKGQFEQQRAQELEAQQRELDERIKESERHLAKTFKGITKQETSAMLELLSKKGASQEDIRLLVARPWAAELAMYASKWLDLQAKAPQAVKKVAAVAPKPPAANRSAPPRNEQLVNAALSKQSISTKDFAAALAASRRK